jgi:uncharacterized protein (TIGR02757 family)
MPDDIKAILDHAVSLYMQPQFLHTDPISVPHRFSKLQDIEIAGLWTAILSWGNRKTIMDNAGKLMTLMDNAPHDFIIHHIESDRRRFLSFKHRTFNDTDTLYFLEFFQQYYRQHQSLEDAFARHLTEDDLHVGRAIAGFHHLFFSLPYAPDRTKKHISNPERHSACKRLNMFLRWMVRRPESGVDFGLWKRISPSQLLIPLDVHVERVARNLGLLQRKASDWQAVLELTAALRNFDPEDPVKYDFALFGIGVLASKNY